MGGCSSCEASAVRRASDHEAPVSLKGELTGIVDDLIDACDKSRLSMDPELASMLRGALSRISDKIFALPTHAAAAHPGCATIVQACEDLRQTLAGTDGLTRKGKEFFVEASQGLAHCIEAITGHSPDEAAALQRAAAGANANFRDPMAALPEEFVDLIRSFLSPTDRALGRGVNLNWKRWMDSPHWLDYLGNLARCEFRSPTAVHVLRARQVDPELAGELRSWSAATGVTYVLTELNLSAHTGITDAQTAGLGFPEGFGPPLLLVGGEPANNPMIFAVNRAGWLASGRPAHPLALREHERRVVDLIPVVGTNSACVVLANGHSLLCTALHGNVDLRLPAGTRPLAACRTTLRLDNCELRPLERYGSIPPLAGIFFHALLHSPAGSQVYALGTRAPAGTPECAESVVCVYNAETQVVFDTPVRAGNVANFGWRGDDLLLVMKDDFSRCFAIGPDAPTGEFRTLSAPVRQLT